MKTSQLHAETESSRLWDRVHKVEYDNEAAAARIALLEDLARSVAGLADSALQIADLNFYRATIREWRKQARELMA